MMKNLFSICPLIFTCPFSIYNLFNSNIIVWWIWYFSLLFYNNYLSWLCWFLKQNLIVKPFLLRNFTVTIKVNRFLNVVQAIGNIFNKTRWFNSAINDDIIWISQNEQWIKTHRSYVLASKTIFIIPYLLTSIQIIWR